MSTQSVRSILRIVAVVTILVGGIGVSTGIIGAIGLSLWSAPDGLSIQHSVTTMGFFGVLSWLAVVAWGVALYQLSPGIARHITCEPEPAETRPKPVSGESLSR